MKLTIYTGDEDYINRGTVTILYDRITKVNLYIPTGFYMSVSPERIAAEWEAEKTGVPLTTHHIYNRNVDYKFHIQKLSKASHPYRSSKLTHELKSTQLTDYIGSRTMFIKLTVWEKFLLTLNLRKFVWQTKEFKKHIYFHIGTNIVSAGLGILGTILVFRGCGTSKGQSDTQPTQIIHDTIIVESPKSSSKSDAYGNSTVQFQPVKDSANLGRGLSN